jgi:RNA polymerase sigma factor (sigma-70 family)
MDRVDTRPHDEDETEAALVRLAKAGDMHAAGQVIWRHRQGVLGAARSIAGSRLDAEDLVSLAVARLLDMWSRGTGPDSGVGGYLARMVRNAAIDEYRSPRSRGVSIDADEGEQLAPRLLIHDDASVREVELEREFEAVRLGLGRLPDRYQLLLREAVVHRRKPAELVVELGASSTSISSMLRRAKLALRRSVLVVHLEAGEEDCRDNAERIPELVFDEPGGHAETESGLRHIRDCDVCRRNWARFGAMSGALGILPAVVLIQSGAEPTAAASAVAAGALGGDDQPRASTPPSVPPAPPVPPVPATPAAVAGATRGLARGWVAVAAAVLVVGGGAALVLGLLVPSLAAGQVPTGQIVELDTEHSPAARLSASAVVDGAGATLSVAFSVPGHDWQIDSATLQLPEHVRLVEAPRGWTCEPAAVAYLCEVDGQNPVGGTFRVAAEPGPRSAAGPVSLVLQAETEDGTGVTAVVSGDMR